MKKLLYCTLLLTFLGLNVSYGRDNADELSVMSFNLRRGGTEKMDERDGKNRWDKRKEAAVKLINHCSPDVFGIQEGLLAQVDYISDNCPQYARVGVGRKDGKMTSKSCEFNAVYYRKDRFELLDSGTFWLSETPSEPSKGWDAKNFRISTWVKLRCVEGGEFYFFNTHIETKKCPAAQTNGVKVLMDKIREIAGGAAVVLCGDFNVEPDNAVLEPLLGTFADSRRDSPQTDGKGSYNSFGKKSSQYDHILYRGLKPLSFRTVDGNYGVPYVSNHYPVMCVFRYPCKRADSPLADLRDKFREAAAFNYAGSAEVTDNFILYSDYGSGNDVLLLQLYNAVHLPDAEVERLFSLYDGKKWTDIKYGDQTRGRWNPTLHLTRLLSLTKLYVSPESKWYKDERLGKLIHSAIAYWYEITPVCPNWWHNNIGVPKKMTTVLLMIYDELSQEEIDGGLRLLEKSAFGKTGQNKVWLAANQLMKGLLTDDEALVVKAKDTIAEEIRVTTAEGLQPDWSFHQHGPQIQFGNYGLTYVDVLSFWFRVLEGSPYDFSPEHYDMLVGLMDNGIGQSIWKGLMDPSFCGRQNFINGGRGKAYAYAIGAQNLAAMNKPESEHFARVAQECLEPSLYDNSTVGATYYWRSDCGIYRTGDWYSSIRMHSWRTVGFEHTNRENLLANFSADGALLLLQHGHEYENIFAHWDWRKIPGTTTYQDYLPIKNAVKSVPGRRNWSHWVGGVTLDDVMASTMELKRDSLYALKSNFFFDDAVVALGSGINSINPECLALTTGIDQTHLVGDVVLGAGRGGRQETILRSEPCKRSFDNLKWVWHDDRGYVVLDDSRVKLSTLKQAGKWDWMDPYFVERVDSGRVFKLYVDHDVKAPDNTYAYALVPGASVSETAAFAKEKPVRILSNTPDCQAVEYKGVICAVFHKAGTLVVGKKDSVSVDCPMLLIVNGDRLNASSPLQEGPAKITLTRNGETKTLDIILHPSGVID